MKTPSCLSVEMTCQVESALQTRCRGLCGQHVLDSEVLLVEGFEVPLVDSEVLLVEASEVALVEGSEVRLVEGFEVPLVDSEVPLVEGFEVPLVEGSEVPLVDFEVPLVEGSEVPLVEGSKVLGLAEKKMEHRVDLFYKLCSLKKFNCLLFS
ncbi:unnamed protein product [Ilex paraguariensis]|uniref:Uncharacterized protein n=1 Tax=Ilex paraguariensis TaxID=185542 RepID=A0ABC8S596_9AQUA